MAAKTIADVEQSVTVKEFMAHLKIKSSTTVYKMIKDRRLKTTKIGKRRTIPVSELARLIKDSTRYGM